MGSTHLVLVFETISTEWASLSEILMLELETLPTDFSYLSDIVEFLLNT
jgi:hypothetical protein